MKRKGQAAMEFLMTYGWAILAAIIVIGVLAIYFRPSSLTSNSAVVTAPLYAVAVTMAADDVKLEIQNNGGETIDLNGATLTFNNPSTAACSGVSSGIVSRLNSSQTTIIDFTCSGLTGSINADVSISYNRTGSNLPLASTGTVSGSV